MGTTCSSASRGSTTSHYQLLSLVPISQAECGKRRTGRGHHPEGCCRRNVARLDKDAISTNPVGTTNSDTWIPGSSSARINHGTNANPIWTTEDEDNLHRELSGDNGTEGDNRQDLPMPTREQEESVIDGIVQTPELATELAWLNGQKYKEGDKTYEIQDVVWSTDYEVVVARRTNLSDNQRDEQWYVVCGDDGILENWERYRLEEGLTTSRVKWPVDEEEFAAAQDEDPQLMAIKDRVKKKEAEKEYALQQVGNGVSLLVRVVELKKVTRDPESKMKITITREVRQVVVPESLKEMALKIFHDMAGHPGNERTRYTMKQYFFWSGYRADIESHVGCCEMCRLRKSFNARAKPPILKYDPVFAPLERAHMDLAGPFAKSQGSTYVLVVKDYLTKFTVLYPIKDKHAEHVARALIKYVASFGVPLTLFSDQGKEFDNELVIHLCRFVGTRKLKTKKEAPAKNEIF